jgi:hypothetical protein
MAETDPKNRAGDLSPDPDTDIKNVRDEEFEIPDPEQVERDRKKAEEFYDNEEKRRDPAA